MLWSKYVLLSLLLIPRFHMFYLPLLLRFLIWFLSPLLLGFLNTVSYVAWGEFWNSREIGVAGPEPDPAPRETESGEV